MALHASRARRLDLDALASSWQRALDAAQHALEAAHHELPSAEIAARAQRLVEERKVAAQALERLAETASIRPTPWLSPVPLRPAMLGLAEGVQACIFDLEGVLTDSAALHAWAWAETFDDSSDASRTARGVSQSPSTASSSTARSWTAGPVSTARRPSSAAAGSAFPSVIPTTRRA